MHDAAACRHRLYVAHPQSAFGAGDVLMRDHAFADIGDDFEISVAVHWKSGLRRNLRVGQHPHRAEAKNGCIGVLGRAAKMVADAKPGCIDAVKFSERRDSDHDAGKMR